MIGGITLGTNGGTQPKPSDTTNETDGSDEPKADSGTDQTDGTSDPQTKPAEGPDTSTGTKPVEASTDTTGAGATFGYPATQDATARSAEADGLGIAPDLAPAAGFGLRAAASQMRLQTQAVLQIQAMADPVFGPPAPGGPILDIVYNEGVEAARPPEQPESLNMVG
ncbi:hypothetical protein ILP92_09105 [Maribius pontilimi]|uniref:Uncharacterized protein n=1 Tax=Palleronia pontilimi TaxID=1964209 RepID=A0A934M9T8_9RHOB|nr:hypothetical protein [Palleronia pontilimi]MBJ3762902.1 hypothetical protein [Palleronia pontilimi]